MIRECKEELNILISVGDVFMDIVHEYPDITVPYVVQCNNSGR